MAKLNLKIGNLIIIFGLFSILVIVVVAALNPWEMVKKRHDESLNLDARFMVDALKKHYGSALETSLGFTPVTEELFGPLDLKQENRNFELVVGKIAGNDAQFYACFLPQSKAIRDAACANGNLYILGENGVRTKILINACRQPAIWQTTTWYTCFPN